MEQHRHNHDHHEHQHFDAGNVTRIFYAGIALNILFTAIEFLLGYLNNSLALLSDASHNLSDVASLIISLIGMKLAQKASTVSYTYGYKKASILASLINAVFLVLVVIGIVKEAVERIANPPSVSGNIIMIVAAVGVLINSVSALLFFKGQKSDINIKGAFLHLMVDALVSVGVVVSGLLLRYTGWNLIDPVISIVIGVIILVTTWGLLKESIRLVIDAVPKAINIETIIQKMNSVTDVESVHHVHVWALSSQVNALSAHVLVQNNSVHKWEHIKADMKHLLEHENIQHVTLEMEIATSCNDKDC